MAVPLAPWKQLLLNSLESNGSLKHSTYFQLATIGLNGRPSNRTVVFRSCKVEEIKRFPFGEICWYFTDSWEQYRISGSIDVIDGSSRDQMKLLQREKAWFASSPRSRQQYLGPIPGLPCILEEPNQELSLDPSAGPVVAFCLLIVDPDQVDYLNLKSNERLAFTIKNNDDGGKCWDSKKINP
ncbi:pyridoxine/pyridoxamine 5'-phosphate oxidase 2-like isoform X3 [Papaver somniferum]|uniref:pyridoxine/pyridoxamine 5'-phosphate oxidase 2-like isoform X3 n=1 Tax=Papaver somniferum TaxID=3469 RepID=UPI000E6FD2BA|nr:pyridoxine/pyridoxamine 5'-phosphate oxidase 2-like isoform X3 [Papaver somniferum]